MTDPAIRNTMDWLRAVSPDVGGAFDADIVERMATRIVEAIGRGEMLLPETFLALTRVQAILAGRLLVGEPVDVVRRHCRTYGRLLGNEAVAFRDAIKADEERARVHA